MDGGWMDGGWWMSGDVAESAPFEGEWGSKNWPPSSVAGRFPSNNRSGPHSAPWRTMQEEKSFRRLVVWQEAMELVEDVYSISRRFPADERFGLSSQLRRAAVSIPSNIGEGARRKRRKAYLNHLDIALGSQAEVDVQLEIAERLTFCRAADVESVRQRVDRIGRMLNGLITSLQPTDEDWE